MTSVYYFRYHSIETTETDTVEDGIRCLAGIEDNGWGFGVGVYDPGAKTLYTPNHNVADRTPEELLEQKRNSLEGFGIEIDEIEIYER